MTTVQTATQTSTNETGVTNMNATNLILEVSAEFKKDTSKMFYNVFKQARLVLPQGAIVNWIWTGNLLSFANFYNKRIEASAQKEVQAVAAKVKEIIEPLFPVSWKGLTL